MEAPNTSLLEEPGRELLPFLGPLTFDAITNSPIVAVLCYAAWEPARQMCGDGQLKMLPETTAVSITQHKVCAKPALQSGGCVNAELKFPGISFVRRTVMFLVHCCLY